MKSRYEQLIEFEPEILAETEEQYQFITERHVQVMWLEQKYFYPLVTTDGKTIEVISPGVWNAEAGPDFKKAHLKIGDQEVWGDVEIHLRDDGWVQHQHHINPQYNHVVLHLSFWKMTAKKSITNERGEIIMQSYFENHLTIPERRITQLIDLDLYPYKKFCGTGRCANDLFMKIPEQSIIDLFRKASLWRLEKKRQHLYSRVEDPRLYLSAGLAMALGYKDNSEAFLDLYQQLVPHSHCPEEFLLAVAIRRCGFFSEYYLCKWTDSSYYSTLQNISIPKEYLQQTIPLRLHQIRPVNHPIRRIAYLIKMIKDPSLPQLCQRMEGHWQGTWPLLKKEKDFKEHLEEQCELIPTYEDDYWNFHYTFEKNPQKKRLPLIGQSLKTEMLINTFFPLLYSSIITRNIDQEMHAFSHLYSTLKGMPTRKSRYLQHRFFGETSKQSLINKADTIQGAYQIHHDFCIHYEASCEGCPFINRYQETFGTR